MDRTTRLDPLLWSAVDRCLLWLGFVLAFCAFYLYRTDYLLVHPTAEPYYDRHSLSVFRDGLVVVTVASVLLFLIGLVVRRRTPEKLWLSHAASQIWWLATAMSAYALGPVTTPILGLLLLGGVVSTMLFPLRVALPAMGSGMSILVATTVAERAGRIPYAPLLEAAPVIDGRLSTEYVVATSTVAFAVIVASFILSSYIVERERRRARVLLATSGEREQARNELQQALASFRDSEERFRQLAENAHEVFWLMDADTGALLYVSPTFEPMWGMRCADVYERPERFLERVHPDDRARMADLMRQLGPMVAAASGTGDVEYRLVPPEGGDTRWVNVRAFPVRNAEGRIYRVGGLIADITERRAVEAALTGARDELEQRIAERTAELSQSNERLLEEVAERRRVQLALADSEKRLREQVTELELLYQNAPIGLCFHDNELRYVRINERLAAINGQPVAAHLGRTMWETIPDIAHRVAPIMQRVLDTDAPALDIEVVGSTPAEPETERCWLTSYYPVRSTDGTVLGVSAVVQDISELRWAEERARRHLEMLAHASRLTTMGQMATGIAHELNQPLAAIANYAFAGRQKMRDGAVDAAALATVFEELVTQALRAGGIVRHLRGLVSKNRGAPDRAPASMNALIGDVLTLVGAELRVSGIQAVLELDDALPRVHVDAIQIQQVILNLIRNALESMAEVPQSTRTVRITTTCSSGQVEVAVHDSGTGLLSENLDRVFDAFYTTKSEGMGMGLAISRSIIEDHGGRLWAEGNPDGGSTFRFTVPVADGNG
jgi:PAS domain S-box-containing protein